MIDGLDSARVQATLDVSSAIILAAGEALKLHGNDPKASAILMAGFLMAVEEIDKSAVPKFREHLLIGLVKGMTP